MTEDRHHVAGDMTISRRRALPHGAILMQGDLLAIKLPDVMSFVSMIRGAGRLIVQQDDLERSIEWRDGNIVFATSNSPEHSLGQFLLRNGKITQQQYDESDRRVTPQMRHGKVLVMMGVISPNDLWWGVKNQVLEIIYSLFAWDKGRFLFCQPLDHESLERITLSINTSAVIMEGIRRLDEIASIRERITSPEGVLAAVSGREASVAELELSDSELRLFQSVDGKRTIRELVGLSELTEFEVSRIFYQLLSARIIEYVHQEKSGSMFSDVEDSPELNRVVGAYNRMFEKLYGALEHAVGSTEARDVLNGVLQSSDTDELWTGVAFQPTGRFDERMLIANVSELPYEKRRAVLDEGLNTLLSIELFEVSQHLEAQTKVDVFRFISDQKAQLE
ncbi:MAG: DUF4388 domain-containing protein [Acidobacteriota bacterium]